MPLYLPADYGIQTVAYTILTGVAFSLAYSLDNSGKND